MGTHSTESFSARVPSSFAFAVGAGGDGDRGGDTDLGEGDREEVEYPAEEGVGELPSNLDLKAGACGYTGLNLSGGSAFVDFLTESMGRGERDGTGWVCDITGELGTTFWVLGYFDIVGGGVRAVIVEVECE